MTINFFVLLIAGVAAWWLSGYDSLVTGENPHADFVRRATRSGITLVLLAIGLAGGTWVFFLVAPILGIIWAGCGSELGSRWFHALVDPQDKRPLDLNQTDRDLDRLAQLVQTGRHDEAMALCKELSDSPQVSALAMETMLVHLHSRMFADDQLARSPSLAEAQQLRALGRFHEAEAALRALRARDPGNLKAVVLLLQVYALDLRQPALAEPLLHSLREQREIPPGFADFARRRVQEWSRRPPPGEEPTEGIESLLVDPQYSRLADKASVPAAESASPDELLAAGHLSTAIEKLEAELAKQPWSFELRLKLAEAHGFYCRNLTRAAKIIAQIAADTGVSPDQVKLARAKLEEWREAVDR
jgi:hypothetical protein